MKKYLLGVFAVVLAVGFSAFTKSEAPKADKKQTVVYVLYKTAEAQPQNQIANYTQQSAAPSCPGAVRLCAIRIVDPNNDGVISQAEFSAVFSPLDTDSDGTLDDQTESTTLLKKS